MKKQSKSNLVKTAAPKRKPQMPHKGDRPIKLLVQKTMGNIEKMFAGGGSIPGLATGFRDLDALTLGLRGGNLFVIAARPSMGKTALAMNIAEHLALDQKIPVGVFSLDQSAEELVTRMLCSRASINLRAIHNGLSKETDCTALKTTASALIKAPLYIDDTAGLTIDQICARARRMHQQHGIQLLVIDYLQLMKTPTVDLPSDLKALAKELDIPIIVLSQLNRQPETRDGQPQLEDLHDYGELEQYADIVGLLVRMELYEDDQASREKLTGQATLIIAKQRSGPTGSVNLKFISDCARFEDAVQL